MLNYLLEVFEQMVKYNLGSMSRPQKCSRAWLVEQATRVFWKRGLKGTSIRDVGEELGLHPGSIYAAFGSKEQLYLEALRHYAQSTARQFLEAVEAEGGFLAGLARFLGQVLRHSENPACCMIGKTLSNRDEEELQARTEAHSLLSQFILLIQQQLHQALERGEISPTLELERLARFVVVQILGLRNFAESGEPTEDLLESCLQSIAALLGPSRLD